jgi:hypothetical protein
MNAYIEKFEENNFKPYKLTLDILNAEDEVVFKLILTEALMREKLQGGSPSSGMVVEVANYILDIIKLSQK